MLSSPDRVGNFLYPLLFFFDRGTDHIMVREKKSPPFLCGRIREAFLIFFNEGVIAFFPPGIHSFCKISIGTGKKFTVFFSRTIGSSDPVSRPLRAMGISLSSLPLSFLHIFSLVAPS